MLGMFCAVPQFQGIELIKHLSTGTHAQRWGGGGGGGASARWYGGALVNDLTMLFT